MSMSSVLYLILAILYSEHPSANNRFIQLGFQIGELSLKTPATPKQPARIVKTKPGADAIVRRQS